MKLAQILETLDRPAAYRQITSQSNSDKWLFVVEQLTVVVLVMTHKIGDNVVYNVMFATGTDPRQLDFSSHQRGSQKQTLTIVATIYDIIRKHYDDFTVLYAQADDDNTNNIQSKIKLYQQMGRKYMQQTNKAYVGLYPTESPRFVYLARPWITQQEIETLVQSIINDKQIF